MLRSARGQATILERPTDIYATGPTFAIALSTVVCYDRSDQLPWTEGLPGPIFHA
jgi:hypothetical protein